MLKQEAWEGYNERGGHALFLLWGAPIFFGLCLGGCQPHWDVGVPEIREEMAEVYVSYPERGLLLKKSLRKMRGILDRYLDITNRCGEYPSWLITSDISGFSRQTERDFEALRAEIENLVSPTNPHLLRCRRIMAKENTGMTTHDMMDFEWQADQALTRVMNEVYDAIQALYTEGRLSEEVWKAVVRFALDWKERQGRWAQKVDESIGGTASGLVGEAYLNGATYDLICLLLYFWEAVTRRTGES